MRQFFVVPAVELGNLYSVFYLLGILVGSLIILLEAQKRKWPLVASVIILIWGITFAVFFSKLLSITIEQWTAAISHHKIPFTTHKTYLGSMLGGFIGVLIARRFLGFKHNLGDAFAFALPIGLAIVRIGCLLGGCCFGKPTTVPWAIAYAKYSLAYRVHLLWGFIDNHAMTSLPVHPTPVYEILLLIGIVLLLMKLKHILQRPGSLFWAYTLLHCTVRFFLEFVREGGRYSFGLKNLQWILLVIGVISCVILFCHEKRGFKPSSALVISKSVITKNLLLLLPVLLLVLVARDWFTGLEMRVLTGVIILFFILFSNHLFFYLSEKHQAKIKTTSIALVILFIGQMPDTAFQPDTTKSSPYFDLSLGGMKGEYQEICGGVRQYHAGGAGISSTWQEDAFSKQTLGLRGYAGYKDGEAEIYGADLYGRADTRWLGVGLGAHAWLEPSGSFNNEIEYLPMFSLRLGPSDIFFIEGKFLDHSPGVLTGFTGAFKLGLGIGPTKESEMALRFGVSDAGFYFQPFVPVFTNRFYLEPFVAIGDRNTYQLNITVYFRFGRKSQTRRMEK